MNDGMPNEDHDLEAAYRRGYHHGATAMLDLTARVTIDKLRNWVGVKLAEWRYHQPTDHRITPPLP